jgi:hypothetical protein
MELLWTKKEVEMINEVLSEKFETDVNESIEGKRAYEWIDGIALVKLNDDDTCGLSYDYFNPKGDIFFKGTLEACCREALRLS